MSDRLIWSLTYEPNGYDEWPWPLSFWDTKEEAFAEHERVHPTKRVCMEHIIQGWDIGKQGGGLQYEYNTKGDEI